MARLLDRAFQIKREAGVYFGRDSSRDDFKNFKAEIDKDFIENALFIPFAMADGIVNTVLILGQLAGGVDERGIRGRVGGVIFF